MLNEGQVQAAKAKDKEVRAADRQEDEAGSEKRKRKKLRKDKKRVAEAKERDDMPDGNGKPDDPDDDFGSYGLSLMQQLG